MRLLRRNEVEKGLTFELHAFVEWQIDRRLHGPHRRFPGFEAAEFARILLADFFENFRLAARRVDLVVEVAHLAQRHVRVDHLARESDRALAQFSFFDQRIDDAPFQRLFGAERRAGKDGVERIFPPDQARQALRAASAGNEAELDFRQAELGRGNRDAVMAHQSHFEAAAQRRAVNCRDDRLGTASIARLRPRAARALERFAEFGNVGAGDEGAPGADQHHRLGGGIGGRLADAVARPSRTSAESALTGGELIVRTAMSPSRVRSATELMAGIGRFLFNLPAGVC